MHVAQNWRLNNQRYALKGVRCENCGQVTFPPREVCPHCAQEKAQTAAANAYQSAMPVLALREKVTADKDR